MNTTTRKTDRGALVLIAAVAAALVVAVSPLAVPQATAANSHNLHYREFAQGAYVNYSTCPYDADWIPETETICEDFQVFYMRYGKSFAGGSLGRGTQPFVALYEHWRWLVRPDGTAELLSYEFGETADVVGSYDKTYLKSAYMDGSIIDLNDVNLETGEVTPNGNTVKLGPFTWTAATGIYRFGNDGPHGFLPPDVRNRCHTTVSNTNQKFTAAYVTGTVDGVPISTYNLVPAPEDAPEDAHGIIFNSWWRVIDVAHGGENCL